MAEIGTLYQNRKGKQMIGNDLYQKITDKILADMERGVMPWRRDWQSKQRDALPGMPSNALTGKAYRGINILLLWIAADEIGSNDMRFATYKQAQDAGGNVIKGSKSFPIFFFNMLEKEDKDTGKLKKIPMLRQFNIFHVSQCKNCNWKTATIDGKASKPEMPEYTTEFIAALGANVKHGITHNGTPCYIPVLDRVEMPFPDEFSTHDSYRRILYHELIHWTGNTKRCNRDFSGSFGTAKYAREELIAELGAAFVCAEFGIAYDTRHASYIDIWIKCLREDNKAIMQAASAAQKAVDYIKQAVLGVQVKELEAA